jgi:hypothetical protein
MEHRAGLSGLDSHDPDTYYPEEIEQMFYFFRTW